MMDKSLQMLLVDGLAAAYWPGLIGIACALGTFYAVLTFVQIARCRLKTTALHGPPSPSFIWGIDKDVFTSPDSGAMYEHWAKVYGGVYTVPTALGGRRISLCDPKAIAHCYGAEPYTYILTPFGQIATEELLGKGIFTARGEDHRRLRKMMTPAFSNAAIRSLTSVFYDSAYKAKGIWDSLIEANGDSAVIEVQKWMNHISLDTIGIAGFSHDFGALDSGSASVTETPAALVSGEDMAGIFTGVLTHALPWLSKLPSPRSNLRRKLNDVLGDISNMLLTKSRKEKEAGALGESEEQSVLDLLIQAENQGNQLRLTQEEVAEMVKALLIAAYLTTSISLTWALIELCKNPDMQDRLRAELLEFGADPTYDQLSSNLPYLDAVVHETLRLHPPLHDTFRMAREDDVIPLSRPVWTRSGKLVDHISIARGTYISVSILSMNRSETIWGPDAKEFKPDRWVEEQGIPSAAREVQGHRHLLTFLDGPRTCLGKGFAIAEFKIVLSVLVKHFVFAFPGGPETPVETVFGILPKPKVAGEEGTAVPLHVRRLD